MSAATDFLEDKILNHVFRNVAYTAPATVYVGLFTTATTDAGGGTEVTGGGYARQAATFGAPSPSGTIKNSSDVTFPVATGSWGTLTHFAVFDAVSGGNMMTHNPLTTSKTIATDDQAKFSTNELVITLD